MGFLQAVTQVPSELVGPLGVPGALAALAVASWAGVKTALAIKNNGQRNGKTSTFNLEDRAALKELVQWHAAKDGEGRPLAYFPRAEFQRLCDETEEQTGVLREIRDEIRERGRAE